MYSPVEKATSQGYDLQFGTNVLGTQRGKLLQKPDHILRHVGRRSLLSHQTSPSHPHGDSKEASRKVRARGQRELSGPLPGSPGGYPMDDAQPRDRIARGT